MRAGRTLGQRLMVWGLLLTFAVGGVVSLQGYFVITRTVRREAEARVQDAVRVARRLVLAGLDRPDGGSLEFQPVYGEEAEQDASLAALRREAEVAGRAAGIALLDRGLCLAEAFRDAPGGEIRFAARSLRGDNRLVDRIREVVFGPQDEPHSARATVTIFERDVRIATNVVTSGGERAVGTRASTEVAARVLGEGRPWNDRARVLDGFTIASYEPIRAADGEVVGMLYAGLDEAFYAGEARRSLSGFLGSTAVLTLLVSVLVGWLARRLTGPLGALTAAAAASGEGGPAPIEVDPGDPREIRVLGETFNRMSERIRIHTGELETSRAEARKALADYMEVLGFVAHELKSPLAGARMQLSTIEDGYAGDVPATMRPPLAALGRALDYGLEVAQSFNQLSRADGEGFRARPVPIRDFAGEVIRPAMADCAAAAAARRMDLVLEGGEGPAFGDPDLLRVVLDNLLGNAVKYGREGTAVRIAAERDAEGVRVEVRNEGVGVPADKLGRLFEKFYRVRDPATRTTKGTGVGLYLVRRFVELQGGTVGVRGEPGAWIAFRFTLPAVPAAG